MTTTDTDWMRADQVNGLHQLADFLAANPDVPVPALVRVPLTAAGCRALDGEPTQAYPSALRGIEGFHQVERRFGPIRYLGFANDADLGCRHLRVRFDALIPTDTLTLLGARVDVARVDDHDESHVEVRVDAADGPHTMVVPRGELVDIMRTAEPVDEDDPFGNVEAVAS